MRSEYYQKKETLYILYRNAPEYKEQAFNDISPHFIRTFFTSLLLKEIIPVRWTNGPDQSIFRKLPIAINPLLFFYKIYTPFYYRKVFKKSLVLVHWSSSIKTGGKNNKFELYWRKNGGVKNECINAFKDN